MMMKALAYKEEPSSSLIDVVTAIGLHSEVVLNWRQERFVAMGFDAHDADNLAETNIDLHRMEDLLNAGCGHDLAIEILSGTNWYGEDTSPPMSKAAERVTEASVASEGAI